MQSGALPGIRARFDELTARWLPGGKYASAVLHLGGGTAGAQALILLTAPILTRLYSPAEMGRFGVLLAFVAFTSAVVNLRFDMAIVSARTETEADSLLAVTGVVVMPMSLLATLLLVGLVHWRVLSFETLPISSAIVTFLLLIAIGVLTALRSWAVRNGQYAAIGRSSLEQGVGRALVPLVSALAGSGWWGLLYGEIAGRTFGASHLIRIAWRTIGDLIRSSTLASLASSIRTHWRYPLIAAPSTLIDALGGALVLPMLATSFGATAAGELLVVQRVASVPAALIGASIADVFHSRVAAMIVSSPHQVRRLVLRTAGSLLLIASLIYVPLGIASPWLFDDVFGARWQRAGLLIALFTPLNIATLVVSPLTRLYFVTNRPELKLVFDGLLVATPVVSFAVLVRFGVSYWSCMITFVLLSTATYLVQFGLTLWMAGLPAKHSASRSEALESL